MQTIYNSNIYQIVKFIYLKKLLLEYHGCVALHSICLHRVSIVKRMRAAPSKSHTSIKEKPSW